LLDPVCEQDAGDVLDAVTRSSPGIKRLPASGHAAETGLEVSMVTSCVNEAETLEVCIRKARGCAMDLRTASMESAGQMMVKATMCNLRMTEVPTTLKPDGRSRPPCTCGVLATVGVTCGS
jgi:hypothetical protein